ncbi:MAG: type II secretion system protein [Candidatus Levybacteria bacterium]|nr:type II secretion system protein [Candidatus Levybacteria bacterium]
MKRNGFTLIELLVVIAIISVIAALALVIVNPFRNIRLSRDTVRKHDVSLIARELESYLINNEVYPEDLDVLTQEKVRVPSDPLYPKYIYVYSADNTKNPPEYTLCAYLETEEEVFCNESGKQTTLLALDDPSIPDPGPVSSEGPTPTPVENWIACAGEGQVCSFTGTKTVRYGANGSFAYGTFTDGVACSNSVFGDPAWGFSKKCYFDVGATISFNAGSPEVVPVIFLASDSDVGDVNVYRAQVNSSFDTVRTWYSGQLGGKTFNLAPAIMLRSSKTEAELHTLYGNGGGIWYEGVRQTTVANGMHPCDPNRDYYFVTPMDNIWGGMVGSENLGCSFVLPGTQSIPSHMGRMLGGIVEPWGEWWADEIREAQGGVAHELGHGFGGECTNGNIYPGGDCNGLPHSSSPSIMYAWWDFGTTGVFFDYEKTKILQSPFIR